MVKKKTSLEKLNQKALETAKVIKTFNDSIAYAKGTLIEQALAVKTEAVKTISKAELAKGRAEIILGKYGV